MINKPYVLTKQDILEGASKFGLQDSSVILDVLNERRVANDTTTAGLIATAINAGTISDFLFSMPATVTDGPPILLSDAVTNTMVGTPSASFSDVIASGLNSYIPKFCRFALTVSGGLLTDSVIVISFNETLNLAMNNQEAGTGAVLLGAVFGVNVMVENSGAAGVSIGAVSDSETIYFERDGNSITAHLDGGNRVVVLSTDSDTLGMSIMLGSMGGATISVSVDTLAPVRTGEPGGLDTLAVRSIGFNEVPPIQPLTTTNMFDIEAGYGGVNGTMLSELATRITNGVSNLDSISKVTFLDYASVYPGSSDETLLAYEHSSTVPDGLVPRPKTVLGSDPLEVIPGYVSGFRVRIGQDAGGSLMKLNLVKTSSPNLNYSILINSLPSEGTLERVIRFAGSADIPLHVAPAINTYDYITLIFTDTELHVFSGTGTMVLVGKVPFSGAFHVFFETLIKSVNIYPITAPQMVQINTHLTEKNYVFINSSNWVKEKKASISEYKLLDSRSELVATKAEAKKWDLVSSFKVTGDDYRYLTIPMPVSGGATSYSLLGIAENFNDQSLDLTIERLLNDAVSMKTTLLTNGNDIALEYDPAASPILYGDVNPMRLSTVMTHEGQAGRTKYNRYVTGLSSRDFIVNVRLHDPLDSYFTVDKFATYFVVSCFKSGTPTDMAYDLEIKAVIT